MMVANPILPSTISSGNEKREAVTLRPTTLVALGARLKQTNHHADQLAQPGSGNRKRASAEKLQQVRMSRCGFSW